MVQNWIIRVTKEFFNLITTKFAIIKYLEELDIEKNFHSSKMNRVSSFIVTNDKELFRQTQTFFNF